MAKSGDITPGLSALQAEALKRFADQGYAATSLAQIAGDVGIKAPSIYSHFKSKDELFLSLVEPAIHYELEETRRSLFRDGAPARILYEHLCGIAVRFETTPHIRFLLHAAYLPPAHLFTTLRGSIPRYMAANDELVGSFFSERVKGALAPDTMATAYLGIIDSLQGDLIYIGSDAFPKRLAALWAVFELALGNL